MAVAGFLAKNSPLEKKGISVSGGEPDSGRAKVKAREATGVDDFGSRLTPSPLKVAVKVFLSSLTARANPTSLLNVAALPNVASLVSVVTMALTPSSQAQG